MEQQDFDLLLFAQIVECACLKLVERIVGWSKACEAIEGVVELAIELHIDTG